MKRETRRDTLTLLMLLVLFLPSQQFVRMWPICSWRFQRWIPFFVSSGSVTLWMDEESEKRRLKYGSRGVCVCRFSVFVYGPVCVYGRACLVPIYFWCVCVCMCVCMCVCVNQQICACVCGGPTIIIQTPLHCWYQCLSNSIFINNPVYFSWPGHGII